MVREEKKPAVVDAEQAALQLEFAAEVAEKTEIAELKNFQVWLKQNPGKIYKDDKALHKKLLLLQVSQASSQAPKAGGAKRPPPNDGQLHCPKCHYVPKPDAKFCPKCGTKFTCPGQNCGYPLKLNAKFCPKCGRKLGQSQAVPKEGQKDGLEALLKQKQEKARAALEQKGDFYQKKDEGVNQLNFTEEEEVTWTCCVLRLFAS